MNHGTSQTDYSVAFFDRVGKRWLDRTCVRQPPNFPVFHLPSQESPRTERQKNFPPDLVLELTHTLLVLAFLFVHPKHRRRGAARELVNWGEHPFSPLAFSSPDYRPSQVVKHMSPREARFV